jgi:predicted MPP superfamily phosphohydrolase
VRSAAILLSLLLCPLAAAAPEQVHLGLPSADPAHEVSVLWVDLAPEQDAHVVLDTPAGPKTFAAATDTGPGLGNQYEAALTGLAPAATYAYHVGDRTFHLTTAPEGPANFTFVALGDMGIGATAQATETAVAALDPAFVLHSGDISYAEGRQNEWIDWFAMVEPVAARHPWITALGNHETYSGSSVTEVTMVADKRVVSPVEVAFYHERFGLPGNELWYSFDWGGVHFVALDTFSQAAISPDELTWLEEDLSGHGNATWTVAFLHEPPYSSGTTHGSSTRVQGKLVPILEKHGVDLVLAGHEHNYERTWPLRAGSPLRETNDTTQGEGTVYVVSGGAGESLYPFADKLGGFSAAHSSAYHVLVLDVTPDAIEGRYVGTDGAGFADAFRIHKAAKPLVDVANAPEQRIPMPALPLGIAGVLLVALVGRKARRARR